jgi:hypothetical protein
MSINKLLVSTAFLTIAGLAFPAAASTSIAASGEQFIALHASHQILARDDSKDHGKDNGKEDGKGHDKGDGGKDSGKDGSKDGGKDNGNDGGKDA